MNKVLMALTIGFASSQCLAQQQDTLKTKRPVILLNGQPVQDSINLSQFDRIDFIRGKKAIELMGAKGSNGIFIISADGKIPVYGEVKDVKGNKIKKATVISGDGRVLTQTNACGNFFIPSFALGQRLTVRKKGFQDATIIVQQTQQQIELKK